MKERILQQLKEETEKLNVLMEGLQENPTYNALNVFNRKLGVQKKMINESEFLFKSSKEFCALKTDFKNFEKQSNEVRTLLKEPTELNFSYVANSEVEGNKTVNRNIEDLLKKASSNFDNLKTQGNVLRLGNDTHNSIDKQLELSLNKLKQVYLRIKNDKNILYTLLFIIGALIFYLKFYF